MKGFDGRGFWVWFLGFGGGVSGWVIGERGLFPPSLRLPPLGKASEDRSARWK